MKKLVLLVVGFWALQAQAQCPPAGAAPTTYGNGSWIGYVFDGAQNITTNYQGFITENETFDESFCGSDVCNFNTNVCTVQTETFSVRFRMRRTFTNSVYRLIIGGDDGERLSTDGAATWLIDQWNDHGYTNYSAVTILSGVTNMVLDYYDNDRANRVSYSYVDLGPAWGGLIGSDQSFCQGGTVDPAAFTSTEPALFTPVSGTVRYQWEISTNNSTWTNVTGATAITYDIPAGFSGTRYYRRRGYNNTTSAYSNTVVVKVQGATSDQTTYGNGSWIGYVYDGSQNYTTNFMGSVTEPTTFDESFGGETATFATSGCDVYTETFSIRYKMRINFPCGDYKFTIGGDDGVRLSIDGGSTYLINDYGNHAYNPVTHAGTVRLSGSTDLILEYFEDGGGNRVSFNYTVTTCPMPVMLTGFSGEAKDGTSLLTWATATELNNSGFVVERGTSGTQYDSIGFVNGHGNSNVRRTYSFTDETPQPRYNYYRLKQVDFDGKYEYSDIVSVLHENLSGLNIFPNPAEDYITVQSNDEVLSLHLMSAVTNQQIALIRQDDRALLSGVAPGVYVLIVRTTRKTFYEKMVVK